MMPWLELYFVSADNKEMKILFERSLCIASDDFVEKLENDSVNEYIDFAMEQCEEYLKKKAKMGQFWEINLASDLHHKIKIGLIDF